MSKNKYTMTRKLPLTKRQEETFAALQIYIKKKGIAPTFNELSDIVGYNCRDVLHSLRKRHLISWKSRTPRSLAILNRPTAPSTAVPKASAKLEPKIITPPQPRAPRLESMVTEGPSETRAIFRTTEAPIDYLNNKTIVSVEQSSELQMIFKFADGTVLRIEVQATEEEPALVLYLSTEFKLRRS